MRVHLRSPSVGNCTEENASPGECVPVHAVHVSRIINCPFSSPWMPWGMSVWAMTLPPLSLYEPLIEFESQINLFRFLCARCVLLTTLSMTTTTATAAEEKTHFFYGCQLIGLARVRMTSLWPFSNYHNKCVAWNIFAAHGTPIAFLSRQSDRPTWCKFFF